MPKNFIIINNDDNETSQLIIEKKKYDYDDYKFNINYKIIDSIKNMTFNMAYIKNHIFYGYYIDQFYKCYNVTCKQYDPITSNEFCINCDDVNYNIVKIKNYNENESFGNCVKAYKKYKYNNESYNTAYLEQAFENKIWIENNISFTNDNMKYNLIYYDIETYDTLNNNEVPLITKNTSHIGILCYYIEDTHYILLSKNYKYDINKIYELLKSDKIIINYFENENLLCQFFIKHINNIPGLSFLIWFNGWLTTQKNEYKNIGYDMSFILNKWNYVYKMNVKNGVKMYNQNGGSQIINVDILPNVFFIDFSLLLYNDLLGDEKNKLENFKLDAYLKLNKINLKLDHNYNDLQYKLMTNLFDISDIMAYCCYDCECLWLLNIKRNLIKKILSLLQLLNIPINYIYHTTANNIKCYISRIYINNNLLIKYNINDTSDHIKFEGAYTIKPDIKFMYKPMNTIISDFISMYPNIIIKHNIWPETIEYIPNENNQEFILDDKNSDKQIIYYKKNVMGIIPKICKEFFNLRKQTKQNMKKFNKNWDQYKQCDLLQIWLKLIINSIYGLMGASNNNFLYNKYCAMSTTCGGRNNIKYLIKYLENKNIDVIFVDTDSACYKNIFATYNEFQKFNDDINDNLKNNLGDNVEIESDLLYKW